MANVECGSLITQGLIGKSCTPNVGGVRRIFINNFDFDTDFTFSAATYDSGNTGASGDYGDSLITDIKDFTGATETFYEYTFRKNTASATENLVKDETSGNKSYHQEVNVVLDKIEREKRDELLLLDGATIRVIVQFANGDYWLYGEQEGLEVTVNDSGSGTAKTDHNGYTITIAGDEPLRAREVNAALIPSLLQ